MTIAPVVLLRCDASVSGGIGHLVRCVALIEALCAAGAPAVHISGELSAPLALRMLAGLEVTVHPAPADAQALVALAGRVGAALVHVDSYDAWDELRAIGEAAGIVTSTATDAAFGRRPATVIVDGSPRALAVWDPLYADADVCLGPAFLPLRAGLGGDASRPPPARAPRRVLVMMGGTDAAGYGGAVARAVSRLPGIDAVGLVGASEAPVPPGASEPYAASSAPIVAVTRTPSIRALVEPWDLVVTAAGTTVWELAALGVPMAVIGVADNQRDHYDTLVGGGMATGIGFLPPVDRLRIDTSGLRDALARPALIASRAQAAGRLVDGRGAARIVDVWTGVVARQAEASATQARRAGMPDAGRLYAWRNDDATRAASRTTTPLAWEEHVEWLGSILARDDRALYIVDVEGSPSGTVRFDDLAEGEWEISVTAAPSARGRRLGGTIVGTATRAFLARQAGVDTLVAVLRRDNPASRRLFAGLGYALVSAGDRWERWEYAIAPQSPASLTTDPS